MGKVNQLVLKNRGDKSDLSLGPAYIVSVNADENTVIFVYDNHSAPTNCLVARVPSHLLGPQLSVGVEVLVQTGFDGRHYVLGVLGGALQNSHDVASCVEVTSGEHSSVRILSEPGQVLFEYFPAEKKGKLSAQGNLDLVSEEGSINLKSRKEINLLGSKVNLKSLQGINLQVLGALGKLQSGVSLLHDSLALQSEKLSFASKVQRSVADTIKVKAQQIASQAKMRRDSYETQESVTDTLVEKTRNLLQIASGSAEQSFDRLSTKVKTSFNLTSERTSIVSEKEVRVDGEDILLG